MTARSSARTVLGWIGWAGGDAVGRLILLSASTIVLSRLIPAEEFGISAIVLTMSAAAALLVGAPFEEALVQKKVLRGAHLRTAFGFSMLVALALIALSLVGGPLLAGAYASPEMAMLLPLSMLSVAFSGHGDLATALARRRHRFNDIAASNLISHAVGVPVSIAMALAGAGVWSLIVMRLVIVVVRSLCLQWQLRFPLMPQLSLSHLAALGRFASISFLDRFADNLNYLLFNNIVGSFFGLSALGQLNMAMRIVEPLRGAIVATSHNIVFSHFKRVAQTAKAAIAERDRVIALLAFVTATSFAGLAAIMPALVPVVSGPGWETATDIAICLSLGAAVLMPARPIFTALSAGNRPEFSLVSSLTGLAVTFLLLVAMKDSPPYVIGAARLIGDSWQALFALLAPIGKPDRWTSGERLRLLAPAWATAAVMALATGAFAVTVQPFGNILALCAAIPIGAAIQIGLMWLFTRPALLGIFDFLRGQPLRPGEQA